MILSHELNLLFIKTKKTAGTSFEMAISRHCGENDIVTPFGPNSEQHRRETFGILPRNFAHVPEEEKDYLEALRRGLRPKLPESGRKFWNHMPISEVKARIPFDWWPKLMKITIERHPYEKALSQAYFGFKKHTKATQNFGDYLDQVIEDGAYSNIDMYVINGSVQIDKFLFYETLQSDYSELKKRLHLPATDQLPFAKSTFRIDKRPATEILSDIQKRKIQDVCHREFALFDYKT